MELFNVDPTINLLPKDGVVNYYGKILTLEKANYHLNTLLKTITWKNNEALIFGKK